MATTLCSLYNPAKLVWSLTLNYPAIKYSLVQNKQTLQSTKQKVVMTKIKVTIEDNCGKVNTPSSQLNTTLACTFESLNQHGSICSFLCSYNWSTAKACPRHSSDGRPMETFWETEGRLDINRLESGLVNLKGSAWIHLLSVPKRDAGETAPI